MVEMDAPLPIVYLLVRVRRCGVIGPPGSARSLGASRRKNNKKLSNNNRKQVEAGG